MNNQKRRLLARREAKAALLVRSTAPAPKPYKMSRAQKQVANNPVLAEKVAAIRQRHDEARRARRAVMAANEARRRAPETVVETISGDAIE